jgi:hypothetical protein
VTDLRVGRERAHRQYTAVDGNAAHLGDAPNVEDALGWRPQLARHLDEQVGAAGDRSPAAVLGEQRQGLGEIGRRLERRFHAHLGVPVSRSASRPRRRSRR